jgi:hypothetical protein
MSAHVMRSDLSPVAAPDPGLSRMRSFVPRLKITVVFRHLHGRSSEPKCDPHRSGCLVFVLRTFAGIRPEEASRLDWANINMTEAHVELPGE